MKKSVVAVIFIALLPVAFSFAADKPPVVHLGTQVWWPYQFDENTGVAVEAVKCVMDKMGQPYDIKVTAWARAQAETRDGKLDGFFAASKNAARNEYAVQSKPFIKQKWAFYVLKKNADTLTLSKDGLKNAKGGARKNAATERWLTVNGYTVGATPSDCDKLIKMMMKGRMDYAMENTTVFEYYVSKIPGLSMDKFIAVENIDKHLGVYFSKSFLAKYPGFLNDFNTAIDAGACSNIK